MNCGRTAFSCAIVAALLTGCTSRPSAPASSQALDLGDFKAALIAYIDTHPGVFIGRGSAAGLKDKPLVPLASPDSERRYSLEEFIIVPSEMRFQANYGVQGPEPYVYEGEFTNSANGSLEVGTVKLTRFHVRPQEDGANGGLPVVH